MVTIRMIQDWKNLDGDNRTQCLNEGKYKKYSSYNDRNTNTRNWVILENPETTDPKSTTFSSSRVNRRKMEINPKFILHINSLKKKTPTHFQNNKDIQQWKNQKARIRNPKSINRAPIFSKEERECLQRRERERVVTLKREAIIKRTNQASSSSPTRNLHTPNQRESCLPLANPRLERRRTVDLKSPGWGVRWGWGKRDVRWQEVEYNTLTRIW